MYRYFGRGSSSSLSDRGSGSGGVFTGRDSEGGGRGSSDTGSGGRSDTGSGSESSFFARAFSLALSAMKIFAFSRAWARMASCAGVRSSRPRDIYLTFKRTFYLQAALQGRPSRLVSPSLLLWCCILMSLKEILVKVKERKERLMYTVTFSNCGLFESNK